MFGTRDINSNLASVVIAAFREEGPEVHRGRLEVFNAGDWKSSFHWLDASGLALYFLERIKALALEDAVPGNVIGALASRLANNKRRTAELFDECLEINRRFEGAGLKYANLKGFSLVPSYCPDLSLRYQIDLDFLMSRTDAVRCQDILGSMGYLVTGIDDNVLEFTAGLERVPSFQDLYKPKPQRSVEVHFVSSPALSATDPRHCLDHLQTLTLNGFAVPVLSAEDMFLGQARHLYHHMRSEWTRTSWFLEYKMFVAGRRKDVSFWSNVRARAMDTSEDSLAVGMATWLAERAFGEFAPCELTEWSVTALPRPVLLWLERYGKHVLLTDFPGTKLYLLLQNELVADSKAWRKARRGKLIPLHCPRLVVTTTPSLGARFRAIVSQLRFLTFRAHFHSIEGVRYLWEAWRWKGIVGQAAEPDTACSAGQDCTASVPQ
jgi:Uncharacterised nucleotidyltransferase